MRKKSCLLLLLTACGLFMISDLFAQNNHKTNVFVMEIRTEIDPRMNRYVKMALEKAKEQKADFVVIDMDTYGGTLSDADAIRKYVLDFHAPVLVFINKNAASGGALISIACDSIYMTSGANIGAATVVNGGNGSAAPDKYQSYMRSLMRSTAETNHRNPLIAEGMVDEEMEIDSIKTYGKVITMTTSEAIKNGYCEGQVTSVKDLLQKANINNYELIKYELPVTEKIIAFFLNPFISGLLILCIIGGLYFELQSPGLGFPLVLAVTALILYLVPYYLNGLAANWEILALVIGVILLAIEIFAIPGFGFTGISGIILIFSSLVLMMLNNDFFDFGNVSSGAITQSIITVMLSFVGATIVLFVGGKKLIESKRFKKMTLQTQLTSDDGYTSNFIQEVMTGKKGVAFTVLRPSGKVMIDGIIYDASTRGDFVDKETEIEVVDQEGNSLRVKRI